MDSSHLAKMRWRCRRGTRELDRAMRAYLDNHYESAPIQERENFVTLLDLQDPELYQLVTGKAKEARYQNIVDKMSATMASPP
ncbi:MAG: antitoxin CptB [Granulosicoccus sp.]|jgi:antitoxin CptB